MIKQIVCAWLKLEIKDLYLAWLSVKRLLICIYQSVVLIRKWAQYVFENSKGLFTLFLGESNRLKATKIIVALLPCMLAFFLNESPGYWASGTLFGGSLIYNVIEEDKRRK